MCTGKYGYQVLVVLATNIAESSITIDGIRYIIDNGLVKAKFYQPTIDMECLQETPVSKAQAQQRTGRAGRVSAGKCFRLFTEEAFEELQASAVPEIKRCRLSGTVLQLKIMGIDNLVEFEFMEPPPRKLLLKALEQLFCLGAIDRNHKVTDLGQRMASLPLEPSYAKLLLSAPAFDCTTEVLTIVAMLSVDSIFVNPSSKRDEAQKARAHLLHADTSVHSAHAHLLHADGDHLTFLQKKKKMMKKKKNLALFVVVYNAWVESKTTNKGWCSQHFVNARSMKKAADIRAQLARHCQQAKVALVSCGSEHTQVARCLVTAFYANAASLSPDGRCYKVESSSEEVFIHPTSSLFQRRARTVVFDQLMLTTKMYMRNCTVIDMAWLPELVPSVYSTVS
ncbi:P-loop containing nucleoside triphosphate hydrolase protein [Baffinella frigidus]|nr:P-loop containing nucleoside triphosphate hydrolase protein [Cryptophyta sp. CCMP2293]